MTDVSNPLSDPVSNSNPNPDPNPIIDLTQERLEAMLRRAIWNTLILGLIAALVLWKATGWRNAAMMGSGAAISAVSILEWRRLIHFINRAMEKGGPVEPDAGDADGGNTDSGRKLTPRGGFMAAVSLVLRLTVFAAVIYGSLKCFRGSTLALVFGLSLAMLAMLWEAIRLLRD
jgi:hypothetical protein